MITFRPALRTVPRPGYFRMLLHIVDARPVMDSQADIDETNPLMLEIMIDTGSSLGLLLKTTNITAFNYPRREKALGLGLNGPITGCQVTSDRLRIDALEMENVPAQIVSSPGATTRGMPILKDYIMVVNYCKACAYFKRNV